MNEIYYENIVSLRIVILSTVKLIMTNGFEARSVGKMNGNINITLCGMRPNHTDKAKRN